MDHLVKACALDDGIVFFSKTVYNAGNGNLAEGRQGFVHTFSRMKGMIGQGHISHMSGGAEAGIDNDNIRRGNPILNIGQGFR